MPNPSPSPSRFSKRKTEEYEESEDALYRSFGDAEGNLHRGALEVFQYLARGAPDSTSKGSGRLSHRLLVVE